MHQAIQEQLKKIIGGNYEIILSHPTDSSHGDLTTNIAMIIASKDKRNPREVAEEIVSKLKAKSSSLDAIEKIEIAGPGFINFFLKSEIFFPNLVEIIKLGDGYGKNSSLSGKRIMMEYAHPNPFKSFHIGHLRNIILGESLIRLIEASGAEVIRVNYQGDVGMHIAKCLWSFRKISPSEYPKTNDERVALLGKCYAEGATAFEENETIKAEIKEINKKIYTKEDEEITKLWELGKKWSLDKFHEIYERVDSTFVREYMESEVLERAAIAINDAKEKGILVESQGALIFDGSKYNLDTRVFLNSQGLPTYEGKELGLAYMEFSDYGEIDLCIHNVAVEQISFFKVTFKVQELLDPNMFKGKQYHNVYEFVGLKKGKMSSRKGNVILGNDILNEAKEKINEIFKKRELKEGNDELAEKIAVGAIKYSFLKISPKTYLAFDLDESVNFEGDSGPYIQYTYVRARSILEEANFSLDNIVVPKNLNSKEELNLTKQLNKFPEIVLESRKNYAPNLLCTYLFETCQLFNRFYMNHQVLKAENELKKERLLLTAATAIVLNNGLNLLGIKTVDRM